MKKGATLVACVLVFLGVLVTRVFLESKRNYFLGEAREAQRDDLGAILAYDQSAHWYFPGNPYVQKSLAKLWNIGTRHETKNARLSLWAYDCIRGSVYATQGLFLPHADWLPRVDARIAELRAQEQSKLQPELSREELIGQHLSKLQERKGPRLIWSLILESSFFAWIACVVGWIWKGFTPEGKMNLVASVPWMFGMVVTFTIWIVSLIRA